MSKKSLFTLEFPVRCSPGILYEFLSTAAGLGEWFADEVDQRDDTFFFTWDGNTDEAQLLESEENVFVKYRWDYYDANEYFEFRITQSDVTNETILLVSDFADKSDVKDQQQLWGHQIEDLKHRIGS
ncbi:MAG TPA: START-like domain-containing protein [Edaphocola sp.]|nr:START-like domain-containing protein [Edaphocola sp.]